MSDRVILVTGAAGFLGSAVTVDLARRHAVVALDQRQPGRALMDAAPGVVWHRANIADEPALAEVFRQTRRELGRIDCVLHFAAFYHFGADWRPEYQRSNVDGTAAVLRAAIETQTRRLIFASSMVTVLPPPPGQVLTEQTPTAAYLPYAKSKALGERMVYQVADRLPAIVLRIGGVFSDWCELPPLHSTIKLWAGRAPWNRMLVGRGNTGFPYLHRDDFVRLVRACVDRQEQLASYEVFLASEQGASLHRDLFRGIQQELPRRPPARPLFVPAFLARIGLCGKLAFGWATRNMPYERLWMLKFVDRPWVVDTTYTRNKLQWQATGGMGVYERLPVIVGHFLREHSTWEQRNRRRNEGRYLYQTGGG